MTARRLVLLGMLLCSLAVPALPPVPAAGRTLSAAELDDAARFVAGNGLFSLFHELAHGLVALGRLPTGSGDPEAAVDTLTALLMSPDEDEEALEPLLIAAADGWWFKHQAAARPGVPPAYWDRHGLDLERYLDLVCLIYGSDPDGTADFADAAELPPERQETCPDVYEQAMRAWESRLAPLRPAAGRTDPRPALPIAYGPAEGRLAPIRELLQQARLLELVAGLAVQGFELPLPVSVRAETCGAEEARWDPSGPAVVLCYELAAWQFATLMQDMLGR